MTYVPKPEAPKNPREMWHALWRNLQSISEAIGDEGGGGDPGHTHQHNNLQGRSAADAHPMSAVTGLVADQQRQDDEIANRNKTFFQATQPGDAESQSGDTWLVIT